MKGKPEAKTKLSMAIEHHLKVLLAYQNIMADRPLWEAMFDDANLSKDSMIKRRALHLEDLHSQVLDLFSSAAKIYEDRELLNRIPFRWFIKLRMIKWKTAAFTTANYGLRLMLLLRKHNPWPVYNQKINQLKMLIDQNI